jgi:hypothetical protein
MRWLELDLFLGGFVQATIVTLNFRNIADKKVFASIFTAFVLSLVWGYVVREIVRDLNGFWHIVSYAFGVSAGTGLGVYVSKKKIFQKIRGD